MTRITALVVTTYVLAGSAQVANQKPNFSGRWIVVSPISAAGEVQTISHDATTITLSHGAEAGSEHVIKYVLNGKAHRSVMPSHGSEIVTLATATWKGEQLTIVSTSTYPDGNTLNQTQVWSVDAKGQLVVDATEVFTGRARTTVRYVYRKQ